jgi:hypothetical protein
MLQVVADILRRRHSEGWLVGGSVRDLHLGRSASSADGRVDLDIVVADDPRAVAKEIARAFDAPWFALSERHLAYRVMGPEGHVDVAAVRGGTILADLAWRDFTVNAMAVRIESGGLAGTASGIAPEGLIDPFGGLRDLEAKRLVAVSDHIFADDPLRMMRAVRFQHVLGLTPVDGLCASIRAQAALVARSAPERVMSEIALTLAEGRAAEAFASWEELGLLDVLFPEMRNQRSTPAAAVLQALDIVLAEPEAYFFEVAGLLAERLAQPLDGALSRPVALRVAGMLHGLEPREAVQVGRRLKLSNHCVSLLERVSGWAAGRPASFWPALPASGPPGREAVLFMWRTHPWEPEVLLLAFAASAAAASDVEEGLRRQRGPAGGLLALWSARESGLFPGLPLDGNILADRLGLPAGPPLGAVLREVRLAWEAGEISSADDALHLAGRCSACES